MALRRRRWKLGVADAERVTVGLAAVAAATAGTVLIGELVRLVRRRRRDEASPDDFVGTTGLATRDAFAVAREAYAEAPRAETVLFNMLTGFVGAFTIARLYTGGARSGWNPLGSLRFGERHIHHFVPGIGLAFGAGAAAIMTRDERLEAVLAIPFGAGMGLTFDEAALLLDLRDVYWSREGLFSVQLSLGIATVLGGTILALRMIRRGEEYSIEQGLIPHLAPEA
jgi:hypothetical protein